MPVLKLPESFGNDVPAKVRVHQGTITDNTVVLELDTECGYASVEMTFVEMQELRNMLDELQEQMFQDIIEDLKDNDLL